MLGNYSNGVIVSTADHYTTGALGASNIAVEKKLLNSFELIDRGEFLKRFKYNSKRAKYPWEMVFNDVATASEYDYPFKMLLNKSSLLKST